MSRSDSSSDDDYGGGITTASSNRKWRDIMEEFGINSSASAELPPTIHGVEPLGRLNMRRVLISQQKKLNDECIDEARAKTGGGKNQRGVAAGTTAATSSSKTATKDSNNNKSIQNAAPARRKRDGDTAATNDGGGDVVVAQHEEAGRAQLDTTLLELSDGLPGFPIRLSEARRRATRWIPAATASSSSAVKEEEEEEGKREGNAKKDDSDHDDVVIAVHTLVDARGTPRICSCCARLARYRCPVCSSKRKLLVDGGATAAAGGGSNVVTAVASTSAIYSDPDSGLVCSMPCLELHAATRCGKHVQ